ncbi:beta-ketoacyl synthase N-terminal-like domain-containing protein [Streptomyces sp. ME19-01-6]|uniref:beta-ketoacyl synthase N-terminal-like domain-containing protein n=1 Tax=Streptomyces sp. ME19-01-6 TaxID=3028686 RepID=UPI0029B5BC40|nr:beta-ketoacyl synthase N-terminal-like domain-containing protein [Streptomyces sp. ME19-01-6]MDX3233394.1 beta-ketoacyl synthase N-terminal-like domain-containing protein [Streptomyces sp. ME19-01-6]
MTPVHTEEVTTGAPGPARTDRAVITAWSAVSPYGMGRAAYAEGIAARRPTEAVPDPAAWQTPDAAACLVPGFDIRQILGRAGTRTMDRAMGLAVTAVRELFEEAEADERPVTRGTGTALVLGTTLGSAASQHNFIRASLVGEKPYDVPAQLMPNTLMNCPAGASAIRFGLKGPNTTLAGGRPTALLALAYARRLLAAGRAERALVGAVEEYSGARSWLERHSRGTDEEQTAPLGEGCAVLLVEPADTLPEDRPALAELLAIDVRVDVGGDLSGTLRESVRHALAESGVDPGEVWAASGGGLSGDAGDRERALLGELFGPDATTRALCHELIGDTASAQAAFQLAAVLVAAAADPASAGRTAVITSVDREGLVACGVLRLLGGAR